MRGIKTVGRRKRDLNGDRRHADRIDENAIKGLLGVLGPIIGEPVLLVQVVITAAKFLNIIIRIGKEEAPYHNKQI